MNIIVNPEDNSELAEMIISELNDFNASIDVIRDNCKRINVELMAELFRYGYEPEGISGNFKIDTIKNMFDKGDFDDEEINYILQKYGNFNSNSIEKYIKTLPENEQIRFYLIPHVFLMVDNLILDAASAMFDNYIDKNNKYRYYTEDFKQIFKE